MANNPTWVLNMFALLVVVLQLLEGAGAATTGQALSPADYWTITLPGLALPAVLRQRVRAFDGSPELVAQLHQSLQGGEATGQTSTLCAAGHLYCNAQQFAEFRQTVPSCGVQFGFRHAATSGSDQRKGDFFREGTLVAGAHMVLGDQRERTPTAAFLPRELAEVLYPASDDLLKAAFGIPAGSLLAKESMYTSNLCQARKEQLLEGEEAFCVLSLEDTADQLKAHFAGREVEVLPVSVPASATSGKVISAKLMAVELRAGAEQPYLACHAQTYPFAVHYCHHIPNTRIYSATLQTVRDEEPEIFQAIAVCHLDTSGWDPRHVAFADLHSSPGRTDACHWTHENGLVFVPAAS